MKRLLTSVLFLMVGVGGLAFYTNADNFDGEYCVTENNTSFCLHFEYDATYPFGPGVRYDCYMTHGSGIGDYKKTFVGKVHSMTESSFYFVDFPTFVGRFSARGLSIDQRILRLEPLLY